MSHGGWPSVPPPGEGGPDAFGDPYTPEPRNPTHGPFTPGYVPGGAPPQRDSREAAREAAGLPAPGTGFQWRGKHSLGCFGSLVVIVVLVLAAQILVTPWAFHMGSTFTPLMRWSGVATGRAPGGQAFAVSLDLRANDLGQHSCSHVGGCDDLHGAAKVCTSAGTYAFATMAGTITGWSSTDGQTMNLGMYDRAGVVTDLEVHLRGTWHGRVYQATDGGYLVRDFQPDGRPRAAVTSPAATDAVTLRFTPGDFTKACKAIIQG